MGTISVSDRYNRLIWWRSKSQSRSLSRHAVECFRPGAVHAHKRVILCSNALMIEVINTVAIPLIGLNRAPARDWGPNCTSASPSFLTIIQRWIDCEYTLQSLLNNRFIVMLLRKCNTRISANRLAPMHYQPSQYNLCQASPRPSTRRSRMSLARQLTAVHHRIICFKAPSSPMETNQFVVSHQGAMKDGDMDRQATCTEFHSAL